MQFLNNIIDLSRYKGCGELKPTCIVCFVMLCVKSLCEGDNIIPDKLTLQPEPGDKLADKHINSESSSGVI